MIHSNNVSTSPCLPSIFLGNPSLLTAHEIEVNPTPTTPQASTPATPQASTPATPHATPQATTIPATPQSSVPRSKYPLLHSLGLETNFDTNDNTRCIQSVLSELVTLHKECGR